MRALKGNCDPANVLRLNRNVCRHPDRQLGATRTDGFLRPRGGRNSQAVVRSAAGVAKRNPHLTTRSVRSGARLKLAATLGAFSAVVEA